jgi:hypothetical protein
VPQKASSDNILTTLGGYQGACNREDHDGGVIEPCKGCRRIGKHVLLREILVPFFAGLVLAYLFNPLANRLERLGLNRLLAALLIIGAFITAFVALVSLTAPIIARESYAGAFSLVSPTVGTSRGTRVKIKEAAFRSRLQISASVTPLLPHCRR